jgi:Flp pilus assembly protein TadG
MYKPENRPGRRRRGTAAVEFAALLPLLTALMLGIWEYGRLVQVKQIVSNAAREGGRFASTNVRTTAEVRDHVKKYIERAGIDTTNMPVIEVQNQTSSDPTRADPSTAQQLDRFRIVVTLPIVNFRYVSFLPTPTDNLVGVAYWDSMADLPLPSIDETIP